MPATKNNVLFISLIIAICVFAFYWPLYAQSSLPQLNSQNIDIQKDSLLKKNVVNQAGRLIPLNGIKKDSAAIQAFQFKTGSFIPKKPSDSALKKNFISAASKYNPMNGIRKDTTLSQLKNYFKHFNLSNEVKGMKYTGSLTLDAKYSNWKDTFSTEPASYLRASTHQTLVVHSIPLLMNALYGTDQGPYGQSLRSISFGVDCRQYQQMINQRISDQQKQVRSLENFDNYKYRSNKFSFEDSLSAYKPAISTPAGVNTSMLHMGDEPYVNALRNMRNMQEMNLSDYSRLEDSLQKHHPGYKKQMDSLQQFSKILNMKDADAKARAEDSLRTDYPDKYRIYMRLKEINALRNYKRDDLNKRLDELRNNGLISRAERVMLGFKRIGVGDNYPSFSPLVLAGTKVRGADAEYDDGKLCAAVCEGKTISPLYTLNAQPLIPEKHLTAIGLGYGSTGATFFHFFLLRSSTKSDNSRLDELLHDTINKIPDSAVTNYVAGADMGLLLNKHFQFTAGIARSSVETKGLSASPLFSFSGIFNDNKNTALSSALTYRGQQNTTMVSAIVKKVDAGYTSFGMPFMINDNLCYGLNIRKKLFSGKVVLETDLSSQKNNLSNTTSGGATYINSMNGNINISIPRLPYLVVTYCPYKQSNTTNIDSLHFLNRISIITANTGYQYHIKGVTGNTSLNMIHEEGQFAFSKYHVNTTLFSLSNVMKINNMLQASTILGYSVPGKNSDTLQVKIFDEEISYQLNKRFSVLGGFNFDEYINFYYNRSFHLGFDLKVMNRNTLNINLEEKYINYFGDSGKNRIIETAYVRYVIIW